MSSQRINQRESSVKRRKKTREKRRKKSCRKTKKRNEEKQEEGKQEINRTEKEKNETLIKLQNLSLGKNQARILLIRFLWHLFCTFVS